MIFLRRLPRWMNRIYARVFGYFWIPCPICKRHFGGHESAKTLLRGPGKILRFDHLVCWRCEDEARTRNTAAARVVLEAIGIRERMIYELLKYEVAVIDSRFVMFYGDPTA